MATESNHPTVGVVVSGHTLSGRYCQGVAELSGLEEIFSIMTFRIRPVLMFLILLCSSQVALSAPALDEDLPDYRKASGVSGTLSSIGSDTLANLMTLWAQSFQQLYPNVNIQIQASGSSTAPPALTEGTANLGPMSRRMKDRELATFEKHYGYRPTEVRVAIDALAVFVHRDNPIKGLNIQQLDAIFSSTQLCGAPHGITRWEQLGIDGFLGKQNLQLFGRNSVSGTYGFFKQHALCKGDFRNTVNEQPGSASVVQSISTSLNGIGYSGIGYTTAAVKALPLATEGKDYIAPTVENAVNGRYPLSRYLYLYVNKAPGKPLPPLEAEFIHMILSQRGQMAVIRDGYIPLTAEQAAQERRKLGL